MSRIVTFSEAVPRHCSTKAETGLSRVRYPLSGAIPTRREATDLVMEKAGAGVVFVVS